MLALNEIGGYFGLELSKIWNSNIGGTIALNTGRNALRYIIKAFSIKEIWMPYYTCPIVWSAAKDENCKINFYHVDKNLMPTIIFDDNSYNYRFHQIYDHQDNCSSFY